MTGNEAEYLDFVLEELTAEAMRLVEEAVYDERLRVETGAGWTLRVSLAPETFALELVPENPDAFAALDDYALAQVYGLGFDDAGEDEQSLFRQEFEYDEDDVWEEQPVRELMLMTLGILRDVLRCPPAGYQVSGERR